MLQKGYMCSTFYSPPRILSGSRLHFVDNSLFTASNNSKWNLLLKKKNHQLTHTHTYHAHWQLTELSSKYENCMRQLSIFKTNSPCQDRSNFRIPRNSFTCHWIRISSIVLCLDLQSLPTHVSEADQSCGIFWSLASGPKEIYREHHGESAFWCYGVKGK